MNGRHAGCNRLREGEAGCEQEAVGPKSFEPERPKDQNRLVRPQFCRTLQLRNRKQGAAHHSPRQRGQRNCGCLREVTSGCNRQKQRFREGNWVNVFFNGVG